MSVGLIRNIRKHVKVLEALSGQVNPASTREKIAELDAAIKVTSGATQRQLTRQRERLEKVLKVQKSVSLPKELNGFKMAEAITTLNHFLKLTDGVVIYTTDPRPFYRKVRETRRKAIKAKD